MLRAYVVVAPPTICRSHEALHADVVAKQVVRVFVPSIDAEEDMPAPARQQHICMQAWRVQAIALIR